jgi:hypothetical protein
MVFDRAQLPGQERPCVSKDTVGKLISAGRREFKGWKRI